MNSSNPTTLYNESFNAMTEKTLPVEVVFAMAPIVCIFNLFVVLIIWRTKDLHNNAHFVIMSLAVADAIYSAQLTVWAIRLGLRIRQSAPLVLVSWLCILNFQLTSIPAQASSALVLNLALDRLMCVATPVFYRSIGTRRYILIVNLFAYTHGIVITLFGMINTDLSAVWNCESGVLNYNVFGMAYLIQGMNVRLGLLAVVYASAIGVLLYRYKRAEFTCTTQRSEWRRRWEVQVFTSMCGVGAMAVLTRVIQSVLYLISFQQTDWRVTFAYRLANNAVIHIEAISHFFVYLGIDGKFREGVRKVLAGRCKKNVITPDGNILQRK